MSKLGNYYRIDDPQVLKQIDAFFEGVRQFRDQMKILCETYGVDNYSSFNSINSGIDFCHLVAEKDHPVDETKFRVLKHKDPKFKIIRPRRSNKAFCAEFEALVPKKISYRPLIELLVAKEFCGWMPGIGYKYRPGQPFYFTTAARPLEHAIEVVASEYRDAYKDEEQEEGA